MLRVTPNYKNNSPEAELISDKLTQAKLLRLFIDAAWFIAYCATSLYNFEQGNTKLRESLKYDLQLHDFVYCVYNINGQYGINFPIEMKINNVALDLL